MGNILYRLQVNSAQKTFSQLCFHLECQEASEEYQICFRESATVGIWPRILNSIVCIKKQAKGKNEKKAFTKHRSNFTNRIFHAGDNFDALVSVHSCKSNLAYPFKHMIDLVPSSRSTMSFNCYALQFKKVTFLQGLATALSTHAISSRADFIQPRGQDSYNLYSNSSGNKKINYIPWNTKALIIKAYQEALISRPGSVAISLQKAARYISNTGSMMCCSTRNVYKTCNTYVISETCYNGMSHDIAQRLLREFGFITLARGLQKTVMVLPPIECKHLRKYCGVLATTHSRRTGEEDADVSGLYSSFVRLEMTFGPPSLIIYFTAMRSVSRRSLPNFSRYATFSSTNILDTQPFNYLQKNVDYSLRHSRSPRYWRRLLSVTFLPKQNLVNFESHPTSQNPKIKDQGNATFLSPSWTESGERHQFESQLSAPNSNCCGRLFNKVINGLGLNRIVIRNAGLKMKAILRIGKQI